MKKQMKKQKKTQAQSQVEPVENTQHKIAFSGLELFHHWMRQVILTPRSVERTWKMIAKISVVLREIEKQFDEKEKHNNDDN